MDRELFRLVIRSNSGRARGVADGIGLGDTFDGDVATSDGVFGGEDHAERSMVERSNTQEASVQQLALLEAITHAVHLRMSAGEGVS